MIPLLLFILIFHIKLECVFNTLKNIHIANMQ